MIHKLVIIILLYFFYRSVKNWYLSNFSNGTSNLKDNPNKKRGRIEGEMIQDPHCNVYFSKSEAVQLELDGKTYYFCSAECRDEFSASKK